ncbi:hypothetical protein NQ314_002511 [Rhamnusium bicolor]|uniref:Ankyrin repeat protein n=1 Tax=Rhamnusium bicolor TaxID=1586634 RepID=A0AAV8ZPJ9_9CUCU|nr:hypothetical protein NQ314_002511 [Rhamnusium bicolor]
MNLMKGETPLHLASRGCRPDVVRHLINYIKEHKGEVKAAAYVNEVNENDESALHYVCTVTKEEVETPHSDRDVVKLLLENGADVKLQTKLHDSAFHYVAVAGNNDVIMEMIAHMSPTDAQKALNRQNVNGWTPLLIASHKGQSRALRAFFLVGNYLLQNKIFNISIFCRPYRAGEQSISESCQGRCVRHRWTFSVTSSSRARLPTSV